MKLESIIYLDDFIKIYCVKTEGDELSPNLVQNIRICYSIGLIDNSGAKIKETIKVGKKD